MKKNITPIIVSVVLMILVLCLILPFIPPAHAVVRTYDRDVRSISMTSTLAGTTDQLFTVTGGRIEIISLFGECTLDAGSPGNTLIQLDSATDPNYDRDFSTTVDIGALGIGDVVRFSNAIDEGILRLTSNEGAGQSLSWFCSPGEIELNTASGTTGTIIWYMSYRKLESGALVTVSEN
ncbi:hypothetical protein LCGC14_2199790 [marine sediment metagenome]|uniref:Uncharacterized protein n=1 Tax=marine sediment metagenome TaxID=412755 RepID=A0A0F9DH15_9ZZZZ